MVLATFNVRYDNPGDPLTWEERRDEVAQIVGFYDVVGIQGAADQVEDLQLGFLMAHVGSDGRRRGGKLSHFYDNNKWELLKARNLAGPRLNPGAVHPTRGFATHCDGSHAALVDGKTLRVYNTHWSHVSVDAREFMGLPRGARRGMRRERHGTAWGFQ